MIRFGSAMPLQILVQQNPSGTLTNANDLPADSNTEAIVKAIRPQLKNLSLKMPYPAGDVTRTPLKDLQDDQFALSGIVDADTIERRHGSQALLLTGPQALHNISKTQTQDMLAQSEKNMPPAAQRELIEYSVGHNCYHGALACGDGKVAQMVVVPNQDSSQAKQTPWLVASIRYPVLLPQQPMQKPKMYMNA